MTVPSIIGRLAIAEEVVSLTVGEELFEWARDVFVNTDAEEIEAQILRGMSADQRRAIHDDDISLLDRINDWLVDAASDVADEIADTVNELTTEPLVLRFGEEAYSAKGKEPNLNRTTRMVDNATELFMMGRQDRITHTLEPIEVNSEFTLHLDHGLLGVIAGSGVGKTTLMRNILSVIQNRPRTAIAFVPWNEREHYSYLGPKEALVGALEQATASDRDWETR